MKPTEKKCMGIFLMLACLPAFPFTNVVVKLFWLRLGKNESRFSLKKNRNPTEEAIMTNVN